MSDEADRDHPEIRVLLVDAMTRERQRLLNSFVARGHVAEAVGSFGDALVGLRDFAPRVVVVDPWLPDRDGWLLPLYARGVASATRPMFVAIPRMADAAECARAAERGFVACLPKPVAIADVFAAIDAALAAHADKARADEE